MVTLSSTGGSQQALGQPDFQVPLPDHKSKSPVFFPPSGPEDPKSNFRCDYSAMGNQWVNCSSATDRKCWLAGPAGQRFDINTDYEKFWPNGTTRKVCETCLPSNPIGQRTMVVLTFVVQQYHLVADEKKINADGVLMPEGKVFNGCYPGPWIREFSFVSNHKF